MSSAHENWGQKQKYCVYNFVQCTSSTAGLSAQPTTAATKNSSAVPQVLTNYVIQASKCNLVLFKLHIAKAVNSTPSYKYGRTITSTTKDCFVCNFPYLSQFLSISNSAEKLDDVTETMDSLFSSTLDTVAPLRLRKIKEKSPTPWYNEHTRALKRAARKMERSWRKTKLEVFCMAWRESTLSYRKA